MIDPMTNMLVRMLRRLTNSPMYTFAGVTWLIPFIKNSLDSADPMLNFLLEWAVFGFLSLGALLETIAILARCRKNDSGITPIPPPAPASDERDDVVGNPGGVRDSAE